jgi:hypothetical protein
MTAMNPQETNLLLILGEMRGDLKAIAEGLGKLDKRVASVEQSAEDRHTALAGRVSKLEDIKTRIGGLAVGVGLLVGVTQPQLLNIARHIFGS